MKDLQGEHVNRSLPRRITSTAVWRNDNRELYAPPGAYFLPGVSWGRQAWGDGEDLGNLWTDCVSFPVNATEPIGGNFQLVSSHCTENTRRPPRSSKKHSKAGKRGALAADQQDIFTVEESICYCELAPVSSRMFGIPGGPFLAAGPSNIPLSLIFSLRRRGEPGPRSSR